VEGGRTVVIEGEEATSQIYSLGNSGGGWFKSKRSTGKERKRKEIFSEGDILKSTF